MADEPARKVRTALCISEISGVDRPAQVGARSVLMKRAPTDDASEVEGLSKQALDENAAAEKLGKRAVLLQDMHGHSHLAYMEGPEGEYTSGFTSWEQDENGREHRHPWVKDEETGLVTIGSALGHSHQTAGDASTVGKQETQMPSDNKTVEQLEAELAVAKSVGALNDVTKAFYDALDDDGKTAFLAKSADEQQTEAESARAEKAAGDPVVYTMTDGTEIRKSEGNTVLALAKAADATAKENAELRKAAADGVFEKRANDELGHLPGDLNHRVALLKAVSGIKDDGDRDGVMAILKARDASNGQMFVNKGHVGGNSIAASSAEAKLDALVKSHAEKTSAPFSKAYTEVLSTPEGSQLYAQMEAEQRDAAE